MRKLRSLALAMHDNSFAIFLAAACTCVITMVYGSIDFSCAQQMAVCVASIYISGKMYQTYRRSFEPEYSLLGGRNLEKLFIILLVIALAGGVYVDAQSVLRLG